MFSYVSAEDQGKRGVFHRSIPLSVGRAEVEQSDEEETLLHWSPLGHGCVCRLRLTLVARIRNPQKTCQAPKPSNPIKLKQLKKSPCQKLGLLPFTPITPLERRIYPQPI